MDFDPAVEGAHLLSAGEPVVQGAMTRKHRWGPVAIDVLGDRGAALFEVRTRRRSWMVVSHQERQPSGEWTEVWRSRCDAEPRRARGPLGDGGIFTSQQGSSGAHAYVLAQAAEGIELVRVDGREVPTSGWGWVFVLRPQRRPRGPRPARFRRHRKGWVDLRRLGWWHRRRLRHLWPEIDVEGVTADGTAHPGRLLA